MTLVEPIRSSQLEIAHVLFMDFVRFSQLPMEEQSQLLFELQELVRCTAEYRRADGPGELICLPTGDGLALVFFRDPAAPVHCALEISKALRTRPHFRLRMGIHTGPVQRVEDINANINVSGSGINIAQRVMDCGDAGHILISHTAADLLRQLGAWDPYLHDLGECEVKHGERVHVYNLYTNELGNNTLPERLLQNASPSHSARSGPLRAVILYRRGAEPDEDVLRFLEIELARSGFDVFIDRHLSVGMEWAREIERQVRSADAVIPLLSAASIHSEMLEHEVQVAQDARQRQGRPAILPVRVGYEGALPPALAAILDPLEYVLWQNEGDNDRLLQELQRAVAEGESRGVVKPESLEAVGGAVPLDSQFYVVRPTDEEFHAAITRHDSIVLIKGARQMGKTSLLARGLQTAREAGTKVVSTDFQKLSPAHLESSGSLFMALGESIGDQLDLEKLPQDTWDNRRAPNTNFERYLRREVLRNLEAPLIWAMDEVDRLFSPGVTFASEVFGLFRSWHNERALDPSGPWSRLTLAIAYATEAHLLISDINQSPFNVGTRVEMTDFTFHDVADLNSRYGFPLRSDAELARFFRLLGGQPYLTRRGLNEMAARGMDITAFEAQAAREEGFFGDHLRRILVLLAADPDLCSAVQRVIQGKPCPSGDAFYRLRSAGVLSGESAHSARARCRLYADYLARHL